MYEWPQDFEDGETRAVCSKCGVPYRYPSELVLQNDGFFYCKRRCLEQTVLTRDRIQAQSRKRREQPPPKRVQPPQYAEEYDEEDKILQFIIATAPEDSIGSGPIDYVAGEACIYLGNLILENKRPYPWITVAKEKLRTLADYLLTLQAGSPTGPSPSMANTDLRYGGIAGGFYSPSTTLPVGSGFALAYRCLGDQKYLDGADRVAMFVRSCQCADLLLTAFTAFPSGGGRYRTGGLMELITSLGVPASQQHTIFSAADALKFIRLLLPVRGSSYTYGVAAPVNHISSTLGTLGTMQSELINFLSVGAKTTLAGGAVTPGMVTATAAEYYFAFSSLGGTGNWTSTPDYGIWVAEAIGELYLAGATGWQTPYADLLAYAANPANSAANMGTLTILGNLKGTYDPNVAIAASLDKTAGTETTGTYYAWQSLGYLAPMQSVEYPAKFTTAKNILATPQYTPTNDIVYLGVPGNTGLSYQVSQFTGSVYSSAITGNAYRYRPGSYGDRVVNPHRTSGGAAS